MNLESIIIYLLVIGLLVYFAKRASLVSVSAKMELRKDSFFKLPILIIISVFTLFCAVRYNVGTDYPRYLSAYQTGRILTERYELLFRGVSSVLYKANANVAVFFGLWAFLQILLYLYAFRAQKNLYPYLIYFLFTNGLFLSWMNGIRQDLSSCIILPALFFILEKKPFHYIITCVIASFFHISALFLIVLYPLLFYKKLFNTYIIPLVLVGIALLLNYSLGNNIQQLDSAVAAYSTLLDRDPVDYYTMIESMQDRGGIGLGMIFRLIFYVSIILLSGKLKAFLNSSFFDRIIYPLFILGVFFKYAIPVGAIVISRPFRFFSFFTTIALSYFVYYLLNNKSPIYKVYGIAIIVISLILFLAPMLSASTDDSFILYQTIFNNL